MEFQVITIMSMKVRSSNLVLKFSIPIRAKMFPILSIHSRDVRIFFERMALCWPDLLHFLPIMKKFQHASLSFFSFL